MFARFGDGHYQVAKALQQQFESQGIRDVVLFDPFGESYPALNRWLQAVYYASTSHLPHAYGWGYGLLDRMNPGSPLGHWLHSLGSAKLEELLKEMRPDAVVQTFPLLTMSHLRRYAGYRIPTFTVLTDYVLHARWIHEETDLYFVASEELKQELSGRGVPADRIRVSGIPIRPRFRERALWENLRNKAANEVRRKPNQVLVMAGAYGVTGAVGGMVQSLLEEDGIVVSLVCGRKRKLERQMIRLFGDNPRVRIFGYVEQIERLMSESSCLVTKAGGITLSEAAAMRLPVVVYRPIPGQEEGNAVYWAGKDELLIARNGEELRRQTAEQLLRRRFRQAEGPAADGANSSGRVAGGILDYLAAAAESPERLPVGRQRGLRRLLPLPRSQ
nr:glycosyltransferase [Cohnella zeiphila]